MSERRPRDFIEALNRIRELDERAQARTRFDFAGAVLAHQSRRIRERPRFDLDYRGPLRGAIAAVGETTGLLLQRAESGPDLAAEVEIAARGATPLELVDALGLDWTHHRYGLTIRAPRRRTRPTAYTGPVRVQLARLTTRRETDFAGGDRLDVDAQVVIDFEWPIRALGPPSLRLLGPEHSPAEPTENVWRWTCGARGRDLAPSTRSIEKASGDVMCTFAEAYEEVAIENLGDTAQASVGDLELAVERRDDTRVSLRLTAGGEAAKLPRAMIQSLAPTAILGRDEAGNELLAKVSLMHSIGGTGSDHAVRVGAAFGGESFGRLRSLHLRLATGAIHQLHRLELAAVDLP